MPCVPTEKTRLYLEHKDESETHPTHQQHLQQHMQSHWISIQCGTNAGYMASIKHVGVGWSKILCDQKTFYKVLISRLFKTSKISYSIVVWEDEHRFQAYCIPLQAHYDTATSDIIRLMMMISYRWNLYETDDFIQLSLPETYMRQWLRNNTYRMKKCRKKV